MSMLKQDFKEGVTKMAGKLSNIASNVMNQLQVIIQETFIFNLKNHLYLFTNQKKQLMNNK